MVVEVKMYNLCLWFFYLYALLTPSYSGYGAFVHVHPVVTTMHRWLMNKSIFRTDGWDDMLPLLYCLQHSLSLCWQARYVTACMCLCRLYNMLISWAFNFWLLQKFSTRSILRASVEIVLPFKGCHISYFDVVDLAFYLLTLKSCHQTHGGNFVKSQPIFKILSPLKREGNL